MAAWGTLPKHRSNVAKQQDCMMEASASFGNRCFIFVILAQGTASVRDATVTPPSAAPPARKWAAHEMEKILAIWPSQESSRELPHAFGKFWPLTEEPQVPRWPFFIVQSPRWPLYPGEPRVAVTPGGRLSQRAVDCRFFAGEPQVAVFISRRALRGRRLIPGSPGWPFYPGAPRVAVLLGHTGGRFMPDSPGCQVADVSRKPQVAVLSRKSLGGRFMPGSPGCPGGRFIPDRRASRLATHGAGQPPPGPRSRLPPERRARRASARVAARAEGQQGGALHADDALLLRRSHARRDATCHASVD